MRFFVDYGTSLVFATTFLVVFVVCRLRRRGNRKYPPTMPWLPVVGSLPFMGKVEDWPRFFAEKSAALGKVFGLYAGPRYLIADKINTEKKIILKSNRLLRIWCH